jgi:hypothetical protein
MPSSGDELRRRTMDANERQAVLNVGLHPDLLPVAADADRVRRGLDQTREAVEELGLDFDSFLVEHGTDVEAGLSRFLRDRSYSIVVIGGGVRLDPARTHLFEVLVNTVRTVSPDSVLCFNTGPDRTVEAIRRWWPTPAAVEQI